MFGRNTRLGLGALCAMVGFTATATGVPTQAAPAAPASVVCGAKQIAHVAAPGPKKSATFAAGVAGEVKVLQTKDDTLQVVSVTPTLNWQPKYASDPAASVHVILYGPTHRQVRWVGRLSATHTRLTVIVVNCG